MLINRAVLLRRAFGDYGPWGMLWRYFGGLFLVGGLRLWNCKIWESRLAYELYKVMEFIESLRRREGTRTGLTWFCHFLQTMKPQFLVVVFPPFVGVGIVDNEQKTTGLMPATVRRRPDS
jgi:hypothetical protein